MFFKKILSSFLIVLFISSKLQCMERSPSPTSTDALRRAIENDDSAAAETAIYDKANARENWTRFEPIIHLLARTNKHKILHMILRNPAWGLVNHRDNLRRTPLHVAAMGNALDAAGLLAENRATIDPLDRYNSTPLHYAAWFADATLVQALLDSGADIEAVNARGNTPLDLAFEHDRIDNIKTLLLAGAYIKEVWLKKTWLHFEPLEYYVLIGDLEEARELLWYHPNVANSQALAYAAAQGHFPIVQLLLQYPVSPIQAQAAIQQILYTRALYSEQRDIYQNIGYLLQKRIDYLAGLTQMIIKPDNTSFFTVLPADIRRLLHPTTSPFMYGK